MIAAGSACRAGNGLHREGLAGARCALPPPPPLGAACSTARCTRLLHSCTPAAPYHQPAMSVGAILTPVFGPAAASVGLQVRSGPKWTAPGALGQLISPLAGGPAATSSAARRLGPPPPLSAAVGAAAGPARNSSSPSCSPSPPAGPAAALRAGRDHWAAGQVRRDRSRAAAAAAGFNRPSSRLDRVLSCPPSRPCSTCAGLLYPAYQTLKTVEQRPPSAPAANKWLT